MKSSVYIPPHLLNDWHSAEARFSPGRVITGALTHVLLPACLLELLAIWLLMPSLGVLVAAPFLVLPTANLLLLKLGGGATTHWKSCEASFQDGKVLVRLPAKDFRVFTPSETRVLPDNRLEVSGSGYRVFIKPETEGGQTRPSVRLKDFG